MPPPGEGVGASGSREDDEGAAGVMGGLRG